MVSVSLDHLILTIDPATGHALIDVLKLTVVSFSANHHSRQLVSEIVRIDPLFKRFLLAKFSDETTLLLNAPLKQSDLIFVQSV